MNAISLIDKKKNNCSLTDTEIEFLVNGYTKGDIPDYQMSAFLMAICLNGMTPAETVAMTTAMQNSGEVLNLSQIEGIKVDKHSTGGVGDKTTPVILPLVAACGGKVAKMSGRGLGHTGGTIDKLECIPNFCTSPSFDSFVSQVNSLGGAISSQMGNLVPADKKIYALRDVTATVDSIPLIASSVMSKKLASGADAIVLDVKMGNGAFVTSQEDAERLSNLMTDIGVSCGKRMKAIISDMDIPLGHMIGNCLEIKEAVDILKGKGPEDLRKNCLTLAANMLQLSDLGTFDECYLLAEQNLENGKAFEKWCKIVSAQGGDVRVIEDTSLLKQAPYYREVKATEDGTISAMNTKEIGNIAVSLGAGRMKLNDKIDITAGIEVLKKTGDKISKGDTLAILYTSKEELLENASRNYINTISI